MRPDRPYVVADITDIDVGFLKVLVDPGADLPGKAAELIGGPVLPWRAQNAVLLASDSP
jgi:hypothetical protein